MVIDWSKVKAVKIPEGDCKRVAINGTIVWEKGGLPSEYQQVAYIESSGTQYIDTGVIGKTGLHIVAEMGYTAPPKGFFGCRYGNTRFFVTLWPSPYFDFGYGGDLRTGIAAESRKIYNIDFDTSTSLKRFGIDGSYVTSTAHHDTPHPIYIFCYNKDRVATSFSNLIFKSMTITDENGDKIRDFVPCYRKSDNVAGLYDLVNGVFYTNAGSGTFIKGEDV